MIVPAFRGISDIETQGGGILGRRGAESQYNKRDTTGLRLYCQHHGIAYRSSVFYIQRSLLNAQSAPHCDGRPSATEPAYRQCAAPSKSTHQRDLCRSEHTQSHHCRTYMLVSNSWQYKMTATQFVLGNFHGAFLLT